MKRSQSSIDGFIPRRPGNQLGELHGPNSMEKVQESVPERPLHSGDDIQATVGVARPGNQLGRSDVDESLNQIDDDEQGGLHGFRKSRRVERIAKRPKKVRRTVKWVIIGLAVILVGIGIFLGIRIFMAGNSVFQGNFFDLLQSQPLKEDENGRSNFLILGTAEDDPLHPGGNLTDSMMILSINQTDKDAYMISIPRDLYVDYERACLSGYRGKINVYFSCVNEGTDDAAEQDRLKQTKALVGKIFGLEIHYGVHVNYTVVRDVINAIGGEVTLTIESRDPRGILDSNFDWKCGDTYAKRIANCPPDGHFIQYPNGEVTVDAEHALYLAQARGDAAPTYGLEQSNFDREKNQQKVLVAIKEKAVSAGTLTNLGAVTGLIDALGGNLRTTVETKEIRTLMDLGVSIKSEDIQSISLIDAEPALLTTGMQDGQSIVRPTAGLYDYSAIQAYIAKKLSSNPVVREAANISVLNGTSIFGAAQSVATELTEKQYIVSEIGNAPEAEYEAIEVYQLNEDNPGTAKALEELYGIKIKTEPLPFSVVGETDFVIIIGADPTATTDEVE